MFRTPLLEDDLKGSEPERHDLGACSFGRCAPDGSSGTIDRCFEETGLDWIRKSYSRSVIFHILTNVF